MPFCPQCKTEFEQDITECIECEEELLPSLIPAQVPEAADWQVVESVPNDVAGYILKSVLEDEGIQVYLRCNEIPAYGGIKGNPGKSEWGDILVPGFSVQFARETIKSYFDSLKEE
ncbi:hypothetical protein JT359_14125 [Candidatus Poribacteria bacterium]|nr:hypothetical protein [Candidatus Poribacteria bacterium]